MRRVLSSLALVFLLPGCNGCGKDAPAPGDWSTGALPAPTGAATATSQAGDAGAPEENLYGAPNGANVPATKLVTAINRKRVPPYAGPFGTLKGKVRIEGDPPPDTLLKFPQRCTESTSTYGKLFRLGLDKALADVLVAVTGYEDRGWVPALDEAVKVPIQGCVPKRLTYALTFGQRLDVVNRDSGATASYMPFLDGPGAGSAGRTIMVAIPQGDAVKLYPSTRSPFHYMLRDQLDSNLTAQVFILNYSTHDVTDLDGQYSIKRIPVGKVHVGLLLPVIDKHEERDIEIKEGDNVLDLTFHFDKTKDIPAHSLVGPAPSASASSSASASASAAPKAPPPAPH